MYVARPGKSPVRSLRQAVAVFCPGPENLTARPEDGAAEGEKGFFLPGARYGRRRHGARQALFPNGCAFSPRVTPRGRKALRARPGKRPGTRRFAFFVRRGPASGMKDARRGVSRTGRFRGEVLALYALAVACRARAWRRLCMWRTMQESEKLMMK